jgi:hypothetical protein
MRHHCHCNPTRIYNVGGICPSCRGRTHDVAERHGDDVATVTLSKAEEVIDRGLLSAVTSPESPARIEDKLTVLSVVSARMLAQELAACAHSRDPSRPLEWHLGMVYQQRPELYGSENRLSDLVSKRRYAATPNDMALDYP